MVREGLLLELRSAVQRAKRTGEAVHKKNVATKHDHGFREVNLDVIPLRGSNGGRHYLILFEEAAPVSTAESKEKRKKVEDRQVTQLKQELVATREYLQSIIEELEATNEELQSANEEVLSSNEELQSINEELETAKEELQSTNEELTTVNEELQNRNLEVSQTNDDLTNLLSAVNFAIVMLGSDRRVRRFTPLAGRILNLIPTDLGRPITDIRPGIQVPDLGALVLEVIEKAVVKECEVADADGRWYSMAIRPYRTSDNRIDGAVLTLFDIDPLKRSLEQTQEARDFAQAVVETAAEPMIVLDSDRRIRQANAAFYEMAQVSPEEAAGNRLEQVLRGDDTLTSFLESAAQHEVVRNLELEFETPSGRITALASAHAIEPDKRGLIVVSMRDITRRKKAEAELKASEALFRELFQASFNSTTQGLLLVDGDTGDILEINPFLSGLLGCTREDVAGKKLWESPQFRAIAQDRKAFLQRRSDLELEDVTLKDASGHELPAALTRSLYQAGGRTLIQFNIHDLSFRRSLEEQLRQAQKMEAVGRMAGGMAHDFNNLLTIISGYSELLVQELGPDHPLASQAGEILHAANRAAALTGRLLVFSRRQLVHTRVLNLNDVISSMEGMVKPLVGDRVEVSLDLASDLWPVSADDNQIEQVFLNLLVNARESIADAGKIRISTANVELGEDYTRLRGDVAPGRYVMLTVSDTGSGMDGETQRHIFEPFFTTKAPGKGTGLGLSTVYGIVKQSRGDVAVESEAHRGTTMRVYLPATSEPAPPPEVRVAEPESLDGFERILVVEDEPGVRRFLRDTLEQFGYAVFEAGDGVEALAVLESASDGIDLLLTDVMMPNMDGRELAVKLKSLSPETKVLFVSGYTPETLELPENASFLQKPFSREDLARRIREMLNAGG
ncbi:MAG: PAS domain-containing protein [Acidobacteriota bacterium]